MKLQDQGNVVESDGSGIMQDLQMKIRDEDQHVVIGIIRHKMYSNAIRTIIQEVGCNARDAHREHGCPERPIKIKLPDRKDNSFYIQDFGVGVDPERMENVFVNYGASTKRDDNSETGGFGLGAKSPFAYADQFGIVTVTPDSNDKLILRQYMAIIEGQNSYIKQVEERPAKSYEERGTKIIIPAKPEDFDKFHKWTIDRCRYWDVKPDVVSKDYDIKWPEIEVDFESKDGSWQVLKPTPNHHRYNYSYHHSNNNENKPKAVVDGIPYPISRDSVAKTGNVTDVEANKLWNFPVVLYFNTGDVSMTATREELDYTVDVTGNAIRKRFEEIIKELKAKLNKRIANCNSFIEASVEWNKIKDQYGSIVSSVKWNGHEVDGIGYRTSLGKIVSFKRDNYKNTGYSRSICHSMKYRPDMKVVYDISDSKGIKTSKITGLFENDPSIDFVYVLKVDEPEDIRKSHQIHKDIKDFENSGTLKDVWNWIKKNDIVDLLDPVDIESLPKRKPKKRSKGKTQSSAKVIRKFIKNTWSSASWQRVEHDYKKGSGILVFLKNNIAYAKDNHSAMINNNDIKKFCEIFDVDVYGVLASHAKKVGSNWTPFIDYIKEQHDKMKKEIDQLETPDCITPYSHTTISDFSRDIINKLPVNSDFVKLDKKWREQEKHIVEYTKKAQTLNDIVRILEKIDPDNKYSPIEHSNNDNNSYYVQMAKRYPVLFKIKYYQEKLTTKEKIEYIKAMDAYHGPVK